MGARPLYSLNNARCRGAAFARCGALKMHWAYPSSGVVEGRRGEGNGEIGAYLAVCLSSCFGMHFPHDSRCNSLASGNARHGARGEVREVIHRLRGFVAAERRKTVDLRAWRARVVVFAKLLGKCDLVCAIFEANSSGG